MTTEADLLEDAATRVFTVESSWNTVEMIAQTSDAIIKVVPKWRLVPVTSAPELTEASLGFTLIQQYLYRVSWAMVELES